MKIYVIGCSLIGMALIVAGLYSFLWGTDNDTKFAIKENVEEKMESGRLQSSATIAPTTTTTTTN